VTRRNRSISVSTGLLCALAGSLLLSVSALAQTEHPHYLHAFADLRTARAWITDPVQGKVTGKEVDVVAFIDKAVAEIHRASIDDGKSLTDHDTIDASLKHKDRLHKAYELLKSADKDLRIKEDNKEALGWRKEAIRNVELAMRTTGEAIKEAKEK